MPKCPGIVATLVGPHLSVVAAVEAGAVVRVKIRVVMDGCVFCTVAVVDWQEAASEQTPELS